MSTTNRQYLPPNLNDLGEDEPIVDLSPHIIKTEEHCIGSGRFGDVYKGMRTDKSSASGEERMVAIKVIRPIMTHKDSAKAIKYLNREIAVWQCLRHENIVPFLGVSYKFGRMPALISVWMENGQLSGYLSTHPEADRSKIVQGLARGLLYLHSAKDHPRGRESGKYVGGSEWNPKTMRLWSEQDASEEDLWLTTTVNSRGSFRWMAPELLDGTEILPTTESDVYAFAMTVLEIISGNIPYHNIRMDGAVLIAVTVRKEPPRRPYEVIGPHSWHMSLDELWDLLTRCWDHDPGKRPEMAVVEGVFRLGKYNQKASPIQGLPTSYQPQSSSLPQELGTVALSPVEERPASGSVPETLLGRDLFTALPFSPDSKWIASGSRDETLRIWNAKTPYLRFGPLKGHTSSVTSVAFSPDGKWIASAAWDSKMWLWNAKTGEQMWRPFKGHMSAVNSLAFSPDSKRIVSGSNDRTVRVWVTETQELVMAPLEGHTSAVSSVAFSPGGKRIVSGSDDDTVRLWNADTGEMVLEPFDGHTTWVNAVAYSFDGKRIVSCSNDRRMVIWDAETGDVFSGPFIIHSKRVRSVVFSPDGRRVASGSNDRTVRVWDAETGKDVFNPLEGHTDDINSVAYSPDGKMIASGSADRSVRVWDAETGVAIWRR